MPLKLGYQLAPDELRALLTQWKKERNRPLDFLKLVYWQENSENYFYQPQPSLGIAGLRCPHCHVPMRLPTPSFDHRFGCGAPHPFCPECWHSLAPGCGCLNCAIGYHRVDQRTLAKKLIHIWPTTPEHFSVADWIADCPLPAALILLGLHDCAAADEVTPGDDNEAGVLVPPLVRYKRPFLPTLKMFDNWFDPSWRLGVIDMPNESDECWPQLDSRWDAVHLRLLPGVDRSQAEAYLVDLRNRLATPDVWPEAWREEALLFWRELAREEALFYLETRATEHDIEFTRDTRVERAIDTALTSHTLAQVFSLIDAAVDHALSEKNRRGAPPPRTDIALGLIAALEWLPIEWKVKRKKPGSSRRDLRCPTSIMAGYFAYHVMALGRRYRGSIPTEEILAPIFCTEPA